MRDPVTTAADLAMARAVDGADCERVLAMIPPADRAEVARGVGLELACSVLEAARGARAPDAEAERRLRRLARLLIALTRAIEAARRTPPPGAARVVGLKPPVGLDKDTLPE